MVGKIVAGILIDPAHDAAREMTKYQINNPGKPSPGACSADIFDAGMCALHSTS